MRELTFVSASNYLIMIYLHYMISLWKRIADCLVRFNIRVKFHYFSNSANTWPSDLSNINQMFYLTIIIHVTYRVFLSQRMILRHATFLLYHKFWCFANLQICHIYILQPLYYPEKAGFPIGATDGSSPNYFMLEVHYDNPAKLSSKLCYLDYIRMLQK